MLIDTHAHLNHPQFANDWKDALKRAKSVGVEVVINVGYDIPSSERAVAQCSDAPSDGSAVFASIAVHPHEAKNWGEEAAKTLALLARDPSVIAVGEIGLDFHYDFSPRQDQFRAFEEQLDLAWRLNFPVILHIREAHPEALAVVKNFGKPLQGVAHCFAGTWDEAKAWLDLGFYIGITGIVTFEKKAGNIREVAAKVPLERLLIETDAPYLAPVPHRGKRNEPAFLPIIAEFVARLKGIPVEQLVEATWQNANALFGLQARLTRNFSSRERSNKTENSDAA
ncbi:TatD family hydrolase [Fervidibacter sacchari]